MEERKVTEPYYSLQDSSPVTFYLKLHFFAASVTHHHGLNILTRRVEPGNRETFQVHKQTARLETPYPRTLGWALPGIPEAELEVWDRAEEWLLPAPALTLIALEGWVWGVELSKHSLYTPLEVQLHI